MLLCGQCPHLETIGLQVTAQYVGDIEARADVIGWGTVVQ
jgi:hypothetical protein